MALSDFAFKECYFCPFRYPDFIIIFRVATAVEGVFVFRIFSVCVPDAAVTDQWHAFRHNRLTAGHTLCPRQMPWPTGSRASNELPRISWNLNVHYRIYKSPPPVPILSDDYPVHASLSHFLKIHFSINFPSTPRSSSWSLSLGYSDRNRVKCRRKSVSTSAIDRPNESQVCSIVAKPSGRVV